jgi:hypothetical protein
MITLYEHIQELRAELRGCIEFEEKCLRAADHEATALMARTKELHRQGRQR